MATNSLGFSCRWRDVHTSLYARSYETEVTLYIYLQEGTIRRIGILQTGPPDPTTLKRESCYVHLCFRDYALLAHSAVRHLRDTL